MVFYHSLRLQQATEWWISDHTCIHYINFVSYLKLVHLTLLLACNDLLGVDVAHTLLMESRLRSLRGSSSIPGTELPALHLEPFFSSSLKPQAGGLPILPLKQSCSFGGKVVKKRKQLFEVRGSSRFVWKSEVLNPECLSLEALGQLHPTAHGGL